MLDVQYLAVFVVVVSRSSLQSYAKQLCECCSLVSGTSEKTKEASRALSAKGSVDVNMSQTWGPKAYG